MLCCCLLDLTHVESFEATFVYRLLSVIVYTCLFCYGPTFSEELFSNEVSNLCRVLAVATHRAFCLLSQAMGDFA